MEGGASPRASPFADVRDAGALMQRAGFALPVVDTDRITVTYGDALALMRDLRFMGESNAVNARRRSATRRETLFAAAARYRDLFAGPDGRLPATFEILFLTAWAPHESQQKTVAPGERGGPPVGCSGCCGTARRRKGRPDTAALILMPAPPRAGPAARPESRESGSTGTPPRRRAPGI